MHVKIMRNFCFTWRGLTRGMFASKVEIVKQFISAICCGRYELVVAFCSEETAPLDKKIWFCSIDISPLRFLIKMKRMPVENGARADAFIQSFFSRNPL